MKKIIIAAIAAVCFAATASAQKFAMVDMDYVMKAIPAYETANEQLDQISKKWQKEIEAVLTESRQCTRTIRPNWSSFPTR